MGLFEEIDYDSSDEAIDFLDETKQRSFIKTEESSGVDLKKPETQARVFDDSLHAVILAK